MMALLVILSGICLGQDVRGPEFPKFDFIRERIGHKVLVEGTIANPLATALEGVKLTAIYYDGNRELRRSKTVTVAKIASNGTAPFNLEADQVPNFSRYELYVEYGATTRLYGGDEKAPLPALKKAAPPSLALGSSKDALPKTFPGDVVLTLVVKNEGGNEAEEPTASFAFKVRGQEQLVHAVLDRTIPAGTENTYEVTIPGMDSYTGYEVHVTFLSSEGPRPQDPPANAKELVVRSLRMVRLVDGSGRVSGSFKNGLPVTVGEVAATFHIGKTDVPYTLPGTLTPGELRAFEFYLPSCPSFEGGGGYDLAFKEVPKAEPTPLSKIPTSKKTATRAVETKQIKLPPPPSKEKNNDPDLKNAGRVRDYSVGIRGLMVVEGSYGKNGKYSGDVYLIRFVFIDDEGKPMKPTPTINATIYNKDQAYGRAQRIVTKEQWNADATKINSLNVASDTIACDKKSGELWVAIVKTDTPTFELKVDMTIVLPDLGTWSWKGLSGKFEVAAKTADRK